MFLLRRPTDADIRRFLDQSKELPFSYESPDLLEHPPPHRQVDEETAVVGHGATDFEAARAALQSWTHFDLGWVEAFPDRHSTDPGTVVAVLIRHVGLWSLNGARVIAQNRSTTRFSFSYGTLTNHAEHGEELFEVGLDSDTGDVTYRIRAVSWPQSPLAWLGQPLVRHFQARFRRDSAAAIGRTFRRWRH